MLATENGVHYVDLSGEIGFNLRMITDHGAAAAQSGAICINSCGFDSIPSDLCTYLATKELKHVKPTAQIGYVESAFKVKGGFSGGTLATGLLDYERPAEEKKRLNSNPYILSPVGEATGLKKVNKSAFAAKLVNAGYGGFFIMAHFNTRIVFRTYASRKLSDLTDTALQVWYLRESRSIQPETAILWPALPIRRIPGPQISHRFNTSHIHVRSRRSPHVTLAYPMVDQEIWLAIW